MILPARNAPDVEDVPPEIKDKVTIHFVSDVREVLELALEPARSPEAVAA